MLIEPRQSQLPGRHRERSLSRQQRRLIAQAAQVLMALTAAEMDAERIAGATGIPTENLRPALFRLELTGWITS